MFPCKKFIHHLTLHFTHFLLITWWPRGLLGPWTKVFWASSVSVQQTHSTNRGNPDKSDYAGNTALHLSAQNGHLDCLKFLVNVGANMWKQDNDMHTAMDVAGIRNQLRCVEYLDRNMNQEKLKHPNVSFHA